MPTICELKIQLKEKGIIGISGKNKSELEAMLNKPPEKKMIKIKVKKTKAPVEPEPEPKKIIIKVKKTKPPVEPKPPEKMMIKIKVKKPVNTSTRTLNTITSTRSSYVPFVDETIAKPLLVIPTKKPKKNKINRFSFIIPDNFTDTDNYIPFID